MCGIAGVLTPGPPVDPAVLDRLAAALGHRGPDGIGRFLDGRIGLVQTRLAIVDVAGGDQPFISPAGTVLIANGEIYNHIELRAGLPDAVFRSRSDCEVALHLYDRAGLGFVRDLRGMFAIAIWDPRAGRLVLARDPFGIKPLALAELADGTVVFASEAQALVAAGLVPAVPDPARMADAVQAGFVATPAAGIRQRVRMLEPGEVSSQPELSCASRVPTRVLPHLGGDPPRAGCSESDLLARLDGLLMESVDLHQRADVPYGMFLSGGIDSAAILACMARLNDRPVLAYTAGFPDTPVPDERAHAAAVARAVGAEHVDLHVAASDFWRHLPRIVAGMDEPVADYAIVPTWLLAQRARRDVKVILSGEGGDEMFAGYGRYRGAARPWPFRKPMWRHGRLDLPGLLRVPNTRWSAPMRVAEGAAKGWTALRQAQHADIATWLPGDLLVKLDRCLMAHGLEGRVPFLDPRLAAFALSLPDRLKVRGRLGKWLLRRWLADALPAARPFGAKRGFTVPVAHWMARQAGLLGDLLAADPLVAQVCQPDTVRRLLAGLPGTAREGLAAWTLLVFALWHRHHILGQPSDGGIMDVMSSAP